MQLRNIDTWMVENRLRSFHKYTQNSSNAIPTWIDKHVKQSNILFSQFIINLYKMYAKPGPFTYTLNVYVYASPVKTVCLPHRHKA